MLLARRNRHQYEPERSHYDHPAWLRYGLALDRTFGWLGKYRRLSKDYEYLMASSEAMIYVAMIHLRFVELRPKHFFDTLLCMKRPSF
jgi:transposase